MFEESFSALYLAGLGAFIHGALTAPTVYAVAEGILLQTAQFLTPDECTDRMHDNSGGPGRQCSSRARVKEVGGVESEKGRKAFVGVLHGRLSEGDLPPTADADLARFIITMCQGMTVPAIAGANREELLRLSDFAMRASPK